jgi:hypothetical protein
VIDGTFNFASKADAVSPAGPAPTTSTSVLTIDIAISETSSPIALFSSQPPHSSNRVARTSISAARRALARRREPKKKARLLRRAFRRGGLLYHVVTHDPLPIRKAVDQRPDRGHFAKAGVGSWLQVTREMAK